TSSVGRKSNDIFALPGHESTYSVSSKSNAIFALPGHRSTSSVGRKSNVIFGRKLKIDMAAYGWKVRTSPRRNEGDIMITDVRCVAADFHARYKAQKRACRYQFDLFNHGSTVYLYTISDNTPCTKEVLNILEEEDDQEVETKLAEEIIRLVDGNDN
ncbi:hypothetical protein Tco_0273603, partial [Tanacetum coccineum]